MDIKPAFCEAAQRFVDYIEGVSMTMPSIPVVERLKIDATVAQPAVIGVVGGVWASMDAIEISTLLDSIIRNTDNADVQVLLLNPYNTVGSVTQEYCDSVGIVSDWLDLVKYKELFLLELPAGERKSMWLEAVADYCSKIKHLVLFWDGKDKELLYLNHYAVEQGIQTISLIGNQ